MKEQLNESKLEEAQKLIDETIARDRLKKINELLNESIPENTIIYNLNDYDEDYDEEKMVVDPIHIVGADLDWIRYVGIRGVKFQWKNQQLFCIQLLNDRDQIEDCYWALSLNHSIVNIEALDRILYCLRSGWYTTPESDVELKFYNED